MDLIECLSKIAAKIPKMREHLKTEEATKQFLVLPFIRDVLGYNIEDPTEVSPEVVADVGTKKGEKVDYAILSGGRPIMLIECKAVDVNLATEDPTQLYRYYTPSEVHLAVLTNGINYRFYSDLEKANVIDEEPFFEFSMEHVTKEIAAVVSKFVKGGFNLEAIRKTAADLKYAKGIKDKLAQELNDPSEDLVRLLATRVHSGSKGTKPKYLKKDRLDHLKELTRRAFRELISERVNERLEKARQGDSPLSPTAGDQEPPDTEYREFWKPIRTESKGLFAGKPADGAWMSKSIRGICLSLVVHNHACRVELQFSDENRQERRAKALELFPAAKYPHELQKSPKYVSVRFHVLDKGIKDRDHWPEIREKLTRLGADIYNKLRNSDV